MITNLWLAQRTKLLLRICRRGGQARSLFSFCVLDAGSPFPTTRNVSYLISLFRLIVTENGYFLSDCCRRGGQTLRFLFFPFFSNLLSRTPKAYLPPASRKLTNFCSRCCGSKVQLTNVFIKKLMSFII